MFSVLFNLVQITPFPILYTRRYGEHDISKVIWVLISTSTIGPDLIPSVVIGDYAAVSFLSYTFKLILHTSQFPLLWKLETVIIIKKLDFLGLSEAFLELIRYYLSIWRLFLQCNEFKSVWFHSVFRSSSAFCIGTTFLWYLH